MKLNRICSKLYEKEFQRPYHKFYSTFFKRWALLSSSSARDGSGTPQLKKRRSFGLHQEYMRFLGEEYSAQPGPEQFQIPNYEFQIQVRGGSQIPIVII